MGTRKPSTIDRKRARKLAVLLANREVVVASGLARGIDGEAHRGALEAGGMTIAVLGTDVTSTYPREHRELQELIAEAGALVSQFSPLEPVRRSNFPRRNAVMSGLSAATVVIAAGETSGALIQAECCLKQGRFLFVPRSVAEDPALNWPRKFLRHPRAFQFSDIDEVMDKLQPLVDAARHRQVRVPIADLVSEVPV